jgi:hypothetical protein
MLYYMDTIYSSTVSGSIDTWQHNHRLHGGGQESALA